MRVGISADYGGFDLKTDLTAHLIGALALDLNDDYPDFAISLAQLSLQAT